MSIKSKDIIRKILNNKKIVFLVILAVILYVASFGVKEKEEPKAEVKQEKYINEKKLEKILSNVKGAGKVSVFITYENSGVNNIDAVYLGQNSTDSLDAVFGSEITVENNKLTVNNILTKDTYECTLLEKLPELSKVRLFKNGAQLFALESGNREELKALLKEGNDRKLLIDTKQKK